jgi:predicted acylesterase/phospholipase RssA
MPAPRCVATEQEQRIRRAFGERRLEDLPTPLRVVATEARSGANVVGA